MNPDTLARFWPWLGSYEGLYLSPGVVWQSAGLDDYGRPCCALGVDLPSPQVMARIAWRHGRDSRAPTATYDEVCHEWARIYSMARVSPDGARSYPSGAASREMLDSAHLWLDVSSLYAYCGALLSEMEAAVRASTIPTWDAIPELAKVARARTLWADGDHSRWPRLDAAISAGLWSEAAAQCTPSDYARQNPTYQRSYDAVRAMYLLCPDNPGALPSAMPGEVPA